MNPREAMSAYAFQVSEHSIGPLVTFLNTLVKSRNSCENLSPNTNSQRPTIISILNFSELSGWSKSW